MKTNPVTIPTKEEALKAKNEAIKNAYFAILSEIKPLITLYPTDYLRTYIEINYTSIGINSKHGFYSPLLHLRLDENEEGFSIYYAKNYSFKSQVGNQLDSLLTRCIYKNTAQATTEIDIEDSLNVSIYNVDEYRQAKGLLDRGFKDCHKTTVEQMKREA